VATVPELAQLAGAVETDELEDLFIDEDKDGEDSP
jgi:hypothetical protein